MCGVGGVLALSGTLPPDRAPISRMVGAIRYRGPDAFGLYRDPHVHLGHARLSIVDLAGGGQPMRDRSGRFVCVFNGEIFNHLALRAELEARGHRFTTRSDTEVLVEAFAEWGSEAFPKFNGQWAVAIWDVVARTLHLSRDPLGIRPLYLCTHGGRLYFASEVKALFAADPSIPRALSPLGLVEAFTFWSPVAPRTAFTAVEELEPGALRSIGPEGERRSFHFRLDFAERDARFQGTVAEAAAAVRDALTASTRAQLASSDVPVGAYVSGGLDSAICARLAREVCELSTFSIRFEEKALDESPFQRQVVDWLGTRHHELLVRRADIARALPEVVEHAERPLLRTAPVPMFLLSRHVHEAGFKVVLTGEGADELFAGYDLFREHAVRRFWARQPGSAMRPRLLERLYPYLERSPVAQRAFARRFFGRDLDRHRMPGFSHQPRWSSSRALLRLFAPDWQRAAAGRDPETELLARMPPRFDRWAPLEQAQALEMVSLLSAYLLSAQGDRMLMANSVEGRFPFLDRHVVALACRLPPSMKLRGLDEKHVLKRAFAELPGEILRRPKQPYRAPDASLLLGPDAPEWIEATLSIEALCASEVFSPGRVGELLAKCRASRGPLSNSDAMAVIGVVTTQLLHASFVRAAPQAGPPVSFSIDIDATQPEANACAG